MAGFRAIVLGAAAGGGLPQWNCGCANCSAARQGRLPRLTQSSLAVSADGTDWAILNASPDIGEQMVRTPDLHPKGLRGSPIRSVLLTNGDLDHVAGLFTLRESHNFRLIATHGIHETLAANPMLSALSPQHVTREAVTLEAPVELVPGVEARLFAVPGKVALYLEQEETVTTDLEGEQTVGVELRAGGRRGYYIPGCARITPVLAARIAGADMLLLDGTLWSDDEMIRKGLGHKTGARMGHVAMSGPEGAIAACAKLDIARLIFVHMNNSNPVLDPESAERAEAEAAGWTIGQDGMEIAP